MSLNQLEEIAGRSGLLVDVAQQQALSPTMAKEPIQYTAQVAAEMVGRSVRSLKNAESEGVVTPKMVGGGEIKRRAYTIEQINTLRDHFGTRKKLRSPKVIVASHYKGGCSKSTLSQHIAHYLATEGYRVLVIDVDPQATTTQQLLAVVPDFEIDAAQTIGPILTQESVSLNRGDQILPTNWSSVDLVPAQMSLLDYELEARVKQTSVDVIQDAILSAAEGYDVVVIDTPPSLSYLSLVPFLTADILLTPTPPRMHDLCSTAAFFRILNFHLTENAGHEVPVVRVVASMVTRAKAGKAIAPGIKRGGVAAKEDHGVEREIIEIMRMTYDDWMLEGEVLYSAVTQRLASQFRTLYETDSRDKAWRRAISGFDEVGQELEGLLHALDADAEEDD